MSKAAVTTVPHEDDLAPGTAVGRYRIDGVAGRGGMGTVYRAFDEGTNRNVALKLLVAGSSADARRRFFAECEAEGRIRHEHVMPVYDRGALDDDRPYFVMELLYEPYTLADIVDFVRRGDLVGPNARFRAWSDPARLIADLLVPVLEGLDVANREYRILHRDVKPENVLVDARTRRPYLIDFGICLDLDEGMGEGKIVGTPRFLAPEQAAGRPGDRTDVFGAGALVSYVLTGEPPLRASTPFTRKEVADRVAALHKAEAEATAAGDAPRAEGLGARRAQLEDPTLRTLDDLLKDALDARHVPLPEGTPPALAAIVHKAMAREPEARYANVGEIVADLRAWLAGGSVRALAEAGAGGAAVDLAKRAVRRNLLRVAAVVVAVLAGGAIGMSVAWQRPSQPDFRVEDARAEADALDADLAAVAADPGPWEAHPVAAARWRAHVIERARRLRARVGQARGPDRDALLARLADFEARVGPSVVAVPVVPAPDWMLDDEVAGTSIPLRRGNVRLHAGIHDARAPPPGFARVPVRVPLAVRPPGANPASEPPAATLALPPSPVPEGSVWVPEGPPAEGEPPVAAFLLSAREVTNVQYAEWLDELPDAVRAARVPRTAFVRNPADPDRWLVAPEADEAPVVGIRPDDARAYAAWRAEVEGIVVRLPTEAEWRRAAGGVWAGSPHARWLFLRGPRTSVGARPPTTDRTPYGAVDLLTHPSEIVDSGDGAFAVKGAGPGYGVLPLPAALAASSPAPADRAVDAGFRLVRLPSSR